MLFVTSANFSLSQKFLQTGNTKLKKYGIIGCNPEVLSKHTEKTIPKDTGIIEAVQKYPQILEVFQQYGLGCVGCMAAHFETIGQGAGAHGIDVDALIADLNECIAAKG